MWKGNEFLYSVKILKAIAENYFTLYDGVSFREGNLLTDPLSIAEYKADFDNALNALGKGHWDGEYPSRVNHFSDLQHVILIDIRTQSLNHHENTHIRSQAYHLMKVYLNEGLIPCQNE